MFVAALDKDAEFWWLEAWVHTLNIGNDCNGSGSCF
jgi:hypothetical protein